MRIKKYIAMMLLAVFTGCATDIKTKANNNVAFVEGQRLITEGNLITGLERLGQAVYEEPDNKEIRIVYMREYEKVTSKLLTEADSTLLSGDLDSAEQQYYQVLDIVPQNERGKAGMEAVELARHHIASAEYAKELLEHNDVLGAETTVRAILQENPMQAHARQLIQQINRQMAPNENAGLTLETAFKKPLTMEFKDTDLKSVFEILAKTAGINFIFDKDVRQEAKVSIFVRDNSIEDVMKLLLMTNQLAYKTLNNNSLLIYPNTPAKRKEYEELEVRSFHVAYSDVKQMVAMIRGIVKAKDIYVNERLNLFIMRDTPEAIRLVERLVTLNDLPDPEVMLDVVVLEVTRNTTLDLGPNIPSSVGFNALPGLGAAANAAAATVKLTQFEFDGLRNFTINNSVNVDFGKTYSIVDTLANPRIRVKNLEAAKIHIGERRPFTTSNIVPGGGSSAVSQSVQFIDIGLKLDVEPIIGLNNEVSMKVLLEVNSKIGDVANATGSDIPIVGTRTTETLLSSRNGETQVLAGLINDDSQKTIGGLAGLIDISILGKFFSKQGVARNKTEIVLLITPYIIRNNVRPTNLESKFHFGTANMPGKVPMTINKTAKGSLAIAPAGSGRGGASALGRANQSFNPSNNTPATPNPFARADAGPTISLQAPTNIALDREFSVRVGLIGASATMSSEMQVSYDTSSLELMNEEENSGTHPVKLGKDAASGRTAQLRFKVVAANPGTTEIMVQNILSEDDQATQAVEIEAPSAVTINIK